MSKMLRVGIPYVTELEGKTRLEAELKVEGKEPYAAYLEVDKAHGVFFTPEVSDYLLVMLLLYAMEHEYDMVFDGDITEGLYHRVTGYLIPAISKNIKKYKSIRVSCRSLVNYRFHGEHVGTGLSCGVDSLYTVLKTAERSMESGLQINSYSFFNVGSNGDYGGEWARKLYQNRWALAEKAAQKLGHELLTVDSNFSEFLQQDYLATCAFRILAVPLAFQRYYKRYYCSSSYEYSDFAFKEYSASRYDPLIMLSLSTDNITFELVGGETTRYGKMKYISQFDITKEILNVCVIDAENCSKCNKCKRTMLEIYLVGNLDEFNKVFDVEYFYKHKRGFFWWALENRKDTDVREIVQELKKRREINAFDYFMGFMRVIAKRVLYAYQKLTHTER